MDVGETYSGNIIKEAEEELGLKKIKVEKGPKIRISSRFNYFNQFFLSNVDISVKDFNLEKKEVAEVKWFSKNELVRAMNTNPENFTPAIETYIKIILNKDNPTI